ncbi:ABC transporter substrate-binding protein [Sporosarcina limicola]|uniref:Iron complex transport system substrate-binding protein n=1 Tax=Sporosarcina limicola TaxID=34101 RepID=A0A927R3M0_9BACL|nr:ABC transporter substrate-binding protein [Sporosarcina limicola]MBE1555256.1 iron complex transport system substrate-binding protein [Sporosarcina limicola]
MKKALLVAISLLLLIVLAACSTGEKKTVEKDDAVKDKPVKEESVEKESPSVEVTDSSGQLVTFETVPESVATLNSGDLDILLNLGANVTGRPTSSGPVAAEAESIPVIGNPHQPNFEKIAEVHPTVLLAGMSFKQHAENIERQGTKVLYTQANSIEDIQSTITMFGELFKKQNEAEGLNKTITDKVETAIADKAKPVKTLLIYGAPGTYLAALPNSLTGDLLEKAGGENIASDFPKEENYPQYASLSVEKIIERNPQMVMLITHGEPEAVKAAFEEEMMKNAAWKNLDAVKNGNVVILPSHLFGTNPGTKVTEALEVMKESLAKAK